MSSTAPATASQSIRHLPVSFFGAAMGLAGLGVASRGAGAILGVAAWWAEVWAWLGLIACAATTVAYAMKIVRHPDAVRAELANPAQAGFFGSIAIAWALAAACLGPYAPSAAVALWWVAAILMVVTQVTAMARWLAGGIPLAAVNTGWMIAFIGPVPVAGPGIALGEIDAARTIFAASAFATPLIAGIVMHRLFTGPPLPDALRPTAFILIVPFSLIYANAPLLWGIPSGPALETIFAFVVVMALALALYARGAASWPFGPAWWALTFPLDALAIASLAYARQHPGTPGVAVAFVAWLTATLVVSIVLARTVRALFGGRLFAAPAPLTPTEAVR